MATIKSFTSVEQSRKLAEILPLESADMWHHGFFNPSRMCKIEYNPPAPYHSVTHQWDCPCWSLAALLDVLPSGYVIVKNYHSFYFVESRDHEKSTNIFNNPVDACVEMILKLHNLNLL